MLPNTLKRFNVGKKRWKSSETTCLVTHIDGYVVLTTRSHPVNRPHIPLVSLNPSPAKIA
jgi:hypothetical protein